jgi:ribosomal protein S18 acetylase RimI-like enzyme
MPAIAQYADEHFAGVDALWQDAFPNDTPWNAANLAIPEKTKFQPDLMLVALEGEVVVGSVMAGYDGHRGWISRIAVLRSHQGRGIGQILIATAEERLAALGCVKVNLQVVKSNSAVVAFYQSAGYQVEERISMSKHLPKRQTQLP